MPELSVTLAEVQSKKFSFLREVVRVLQLPTVVWGAKAESLPDSAQFGAVVMRAVDDTPGALACARRLSDSIYVLSSTEQRSAVLAASGFKVVREFSMPGSTSRVLVELTR